MDIPHSRIIERILQLGPQNGSAFIKAECMRDSFEHLDTIIEYILNPNKKIDDPETIEWCKWLIAGGRTFSEYATIGKHFSFFYSSSSSFFFVTIFV